MAEGTREQEDPTRFFTQAQNIYERFHIDILGLNLRDTESGLATQGIRGLLEAIRGFTRAPVFTDHQGHMRLGRQEKPILGVKQAAKWVAWREIIGLKERLNAGNLSGDKGI